MRGAKPVPICSSPSVRIGHRRCEDGRLCLGNGVTEPSQLDNYRAQIAADGTARRPEVKAPSVRAITIPTTLSAGEFTASAGCTDTARHVKESHRHPLMMPR
jgi:maleylacetate reductase